MWEGLMQVWNQVVSFFTQNELIQNIFAPVSGLVGVWFANKTVSLTKENFLAKNVVAEKDKQIEDLKKIVEAQNAKIDTLGAMFMEGFGQSKLNQTAKKNIASLYTNFEGIKLNAKNPLEGLVNVQETVKNVLEAPLEEAKVKIIDQLKSGV